MKRLFCMIAATTLVMVTAADSHAQFSLSFGNQVQARHGGAGCPTYGVRRPSYAPRVDLNRLDRYADGLAQAARHLHEDAHRLRQDYIHSRSIEAYVDRLDRLNEHLHELLHDARGRGHISDSQLRHVAGDVQDIGRLANRLDAELEHQRHDGARPCDYHALDHMRRVIATEIYPLLGRMEHELRDGLRYGQFAPHMRGHRDPPHIGRTPSFGRFGF